MLRRDWLKTAAASGLVAATGSAAAPGTASVDADIKGELRTLTGSDSIAIDGRIQILLPSHAENSAVVPVAVMSAVEQTRSITLFLTRHSLARVAHINTANSMLVAYLATHVRLTEPASVIAVVETPAGWYQNTASILTLTDTCEKQP